MRMMMMPGRCVRGRNRAAKDGRIGKILAATAEKLRPEAALGARRRPPTAMFFFDMTDSSQLPVLCEPLFQELDATVEIVPARTATTDELKKGLGAAGVKKPGFEHARELVAADADARGGGLAAPRSSTARVAARSASSSGRFAGSADRVCCTGMPICESDTAGNTPVAVRAARGAGPGLVAPAASTTARSIVFSSSRTLPGQPWPRGERPGAASARRSGPLR